jgi:hypothetical protein
MVAAMDRPKVSYRNAALLSLGLAVTHLKGNFYATVAPPLLKAVEMAQKTGGKVHPSPSGPRTSRYPHQLGSP